MCLCVRGCVLPRNTEREEGFSKMMRKVKFGLFVLRHTTARIPKPSICGIIGTYTEVLYFPLWSARPLYHGKNKAKICVCLFNQCHSLCVLTAVFKHNEITFWKQMNA